MSSGQPPPIPPHGPRHQPVQWNADQTDMSCHRLTPEQLSRKLASRQSHNLALARATLLSAGAQSGQPLTPALAARLRAATEQSLDSVIAECNAAVVTSRRIRQNADDILETDSATTDNTDPSSGMDNPVSTNATSAVSLSQSKENGLLPDCNGIQQSGSVSESSKESRDVRSSSAPPSIATRLTMLPLIASNGSNTSTYSSISSILRNNKPRNSDRLHRNIGSSSGSGNDVPRSSRGSAESNDTPGSGDDSSSNCVRSGPETGIALCASENTSDTASSHDVNSVTAATRASNSSTAGCAVASRSSDEPSSSAFFSAHPSNETSGYSASNSCSQFRYTENLEAARLEHEKELEKLKEECEVDSPPAERFAEVLNLSQCQEQPQHQYLEDRQYQEQQHQHPHGNLDKTLKVGYARLSK
ncbi:uncharacterized protein LOC108672876 [Hyalella azteca]|uniref:Uncharacterized protein LOC108672876 n=1 Tax=Hyalella azteca TaxID=294128 RepID=A0A8B7NQV4_HYAAZ|nr:uncharacterized protein LOC108672876 [Hyalella azteca]